MNVTREELKMEVRELLDKLNTFAREFNGEIQALHTRLNKQDEQLEEVYSMIRKISKND